MASVNQPITAIIAGANECMVKLSTGQIVSVGKYQQLFDAAEEGSEPEVEAILNGAYSGQVQADGSITDISKLYIPEGGGASVEAEQEEVA